MKDLRKFFESMPDEASTEFFDNDSYVGFVVHWSKSGRGFGEYTFSVDKKTGKFDLDNEGDSPGSVKKIMDMLVNDNPEEVKKLFHMMVDHGYPIDESITLNGKPIKKEDY